MHPRNTQCTSQHNTNTKNSKHSLQFTKLAFNSGCNENILNTNSRMRGSRDAARAHARGDNVQVGAGTHPVLCYKAVFYDNWQVLLRQVPAIDWTDLPASFLRGRSARLRSSAIVINVQRITDDKFEFFPMDDAVWRFMVFVVDWHSFQWIWNLRLFCIEVWISSTIQTFLR